MRFERDAKKPSRRRPYHPVTKRYLFSMCCNVLIEKISSCITFALKLFKKLRFTNSLKQKEPLPESDTRISNPVVGVANSRVVEYKVQKI